MINFVLAEYFLDFNKDNDQSFPEEALGLLKFKDRNGAERALEWVKSRVLKEYGGRHPVFESSIDELPDVAFKLTHLLASKTANPAGFAKAQL